MAKFYQQGPSLGNQYLDDIYLQRLLEDALPAKMMHNIQADLVQFGDRCGTDILALSKEASRVEPELVQYDHFGRRVDEIITCDAWKKLHDVSASELMILAGANSLWSSRIYQFAKLYLFNPSSAIYTCPLAMTDGAARLLELYGTEQQKRDILPRLLSRDPKNFWTSGQWMTERTGGSDVSRSETFAEKLSWAQGRELYSLTGFKWFTSATDANMTVALARVIGEDGEAVEGSRGLSAFLLPVRNTHNELNGLRVHRLKHKLGTRAMPTAELELTGARAEMLGQKGRGVPVIAAILNITRLHNSISSVSFMRRALMLSRDYATKRAAFGKTLEQHPLHMRTLAWLEVETRACSILVFHAASLLGKVECNKAEKHELTLLRLLTPLTKLFTAKRCVAVVSEALESMGGSGYIEDGHFPTLLRDAQVLSIWEGTTNVLSLDVLRVLATAPTALSVYAKSIETLMSGSEKCVEMNAHAGEIRKASKQLLVSAQELVSQGQDVMESAARHFAFSLTRTFIAALLLRLAMRTTREDDKTTLKRWISAGLVCMPAPSTRAEDHKLVYARL